MTEPSEQPAAPADFVLTRTLNAPRALVWNVWTRAEHLTRWFGAAGTTIPVCNMDLRPGGSFHYCMRMPGGVEMWGKWSFIEVEVPEKLVMINVFSDAQGGVTRHPMSATWPLETRSTTSFVERGHKTELTLRWSPHHATAIEQATFDGAHAGMEIGWAGTFAQLTAYLDAVQDAAAGGSQT